VIVATPDDRPGFGAASLFDEVVDHAREEVPGPQRERVLRLAINRLWEYPTPYACANALGRKLGVGAETLRK
jgi:hypothetical protein